MEDHGLSVAKADSGDAKSEPRAERHTPGPWSLSNEPIQRDLRMWVYGRMGPNRPRIATISFGAFEGSGAQEHDAVVANALLIASAPEQNAALHRAKTAIERALCVGDFHPADADMLGVTLGEISVALAKATGERS